MDLLWLSTGPLWGRTGSSQLRDGNSQAQAALEEMEAEPGRFATGLEEWEREKGVGDASRYSPPC